MAFVASSKTGVVDFENINQIKKNAVRGLLKKRAKKKNSRSLSLPVLPPGANSVPAEGNCHNHHQSPERPALGSMA